MIITGFGGSLWKYGEIKTMMIEELAIVFHWKE